MKIQLLSVPYDSAIHNVRMGAGPLCLLNHGLAKHLLMQGHQVHIHTLEAHKEAFAGEIATAFHLLCKVPRFSDRKKIEKHLLYHKS